MTPEGEDKFNVEEETQETPSEEREQEITNEMVEEKIKELKASLIPKEEVEVRGDKYRTFHKTCDTDLELPSKKKQERLTYRALKKMRGYYHGVLYCPKCERAYTYHIEH